MPNLALRHPDAPCFSSMAGASDQQGNFVGQKLRILHILLESVIRRFGYRLCGFDRPQFGVFGRQKGKK